MAGLLAALPPGAQAQPAFLAGYGRNTDDAGLVTGESIALGVSLPLAAGWIAGSIGLPVDAELNSRWGTLAGVFDRPPGQDELWGYSGSGTVFAFDDPVLDRFGMGSVLALDAYTVLDLAPAQVRLRLGGRHGTYRDSVDSAQRLLGRAGAEIGFRDRALDVRAEVDHWRAEEGGYTQIGARVGWVDPRFQTWAGVSRWLDEVLPGTGWDVGALVPLSRRLAVTARGGVQAPDILFQIAPQTTWSVAIQFRPGTPPPLPVVVPVLDDGNRTLSLRLPGGDLSGPPAVAGSFSGWQAVPMQPAGGDWRLELVLEPGVHEYAFVTADGEWFVPEGTPGRKPDGFGGWVAVVIVQ